MYIPKKQYGGCELDSREAKSRAEPTEEVKPFQIDKESFQCTKLRCQMSKEIEESLAQVLTKNADLFACQHQTCRKSTSSSIVIG